MIVTIFLPYQQGANRGTPPRLWDGDVCMERWQRQDVSLDCLAILLVFCPNFLLF
jgi:hypothetical protein